MRFDLDAIYALLPAVYRARDEERGSPLRGLLSTIAGEAQVLERDIDRLYADLFIETCEPWVIPYLADLVGCSLPSAGLEGRGVVANTIAYRRRKGTAAVLEQLARDVTGLDAVAVEFFQRLIVSQHMNHIRPSSVHTPDLRRASRLAWIGSAFDTVPRTIDVRSIRSRHCDSQGRHNIPHVGLFLYRLRAFSVTAAPIRIVADGDRRGHFNALGLDVPLFHRGRAERDIEQLATPGNVTFAMTRRHLREHLRESYGATADLCVWRDGGEVPSSQIVVCNLADRAGGWGSTPADKFAVDPELGRLVVPADVSAGDVRVSYRYGFAHAIGGGEYDQPGPVSIEPVREVTHPVSLRDVVHADVRPGTVRIESGDRFDAPLQMTLVAGRRLLIYGAGRRRPLLGPAEPITVDGDAGSFLALHNLLVAAPTLAISGGVDGFSASHCTLVPERTVLKVDAPAALVTIEQSITGRIVTAPDTRLRLTDCVVDAGSPDAVAIDAGEVTLVNCTIIGTVRARVMPLTSNTVFVARGDAGPPVYVEDRQQGCIRYSWVPPGSRVPRRYRCQPAGKRPGRSPRFVALRYGDPGYGQLTAICPSGAFTGADDGGSMGAFHALHEPQRFVELQARLVEYARAGIDAGIIVAS